MLEIPSRVCFFFLKNTCKFLTGESQSEFEHLSQRTNQLNNEDLFASVLLLSPPPLSWRGTAKIGCGWSKTVTYFPTAGHWDLLRLGLECRGGRCEEDKRAKFGS